MGRPTGEQEAYLLASWGGGSGISRGGVPGRRTTRSRATTSTPVPTSRSPVPFPTTQTHHASHNAASNAANSLSASHKRTKVSTSSTLRTTGLVRRWARVDRAPPGTTFTVKLWTPVEDLTPQEQAVYEISHPPPIPSVKTEAVVESTDGMEVVTELPLTSEPAQAIEPTVSVPAAAPTESATPLEVPTGLPLVDSTLPAPHEPTLLNPIDPMSYSIDSVTTSSSVVLMDAPIIPKAPVPPPVPTTVHSVASLEAQSVVKEPIIQAVQVYSATATHERDTPPAKRPKLDHDTRVILATLHAAATAAATAVAEHGVEAPNEPLREPMTAAPSEPPLSGPITATSEPPPGLNTAAPSKPPPYGPITATDNEPPTLTAPDASAPSGPTVPDPPVPTDGVTPDVETVARLESSL